MTKKFFGVFVFILFTLLYLPISVNASEKTDAMIRKISPDGKNVTIKSVKPTTLIDVDFLFSGIIGKYVAEEGYFVYADCEEPEYTTCHFIFQSDDLETEWDSEAGEEIIIRGEKVTYTLNVTYDTPSASSIKIVDNYLSKLRDAEMSDVSTWYEIEDLSLINYYMTSSKSELWNTEAPGRALRYVRELNEITEGTDLSFYLDTRAGSQDEELMYESAFGPMIVFYGDYAYAFKHLLIRTFIYSCVLFWSVILIYFE